MHKIGNYSKKKYLINAIHLLLEFIIRFLWRKKSEDNIYTFVRAHVYVCVLIRVGWCVRVILTHNILTLVSTNIKYYSPLKIYI